MVGAKLVFPGPKMGDPETLQSLIEAEQVTFSAGVPTVWQGMIAYLEKTGKRIDSLKRVLSGGSAVPLALMNQLRDRRRRSRARVGHDRDEPDRHDPFVCRRKRRSCRQPSAMRLRARQGRTVFGVELKITDDEGKELPRDGKAFGALKVRGPWIASSYYQRDSDAAFEADGWFNTGDVATICPLGYMQITDRTKDVIKSGGEWISSIELENLAVRASGRGAGRRDRDPALEVAGAAAAGRGAEAGRSGDARRAARVLSRQDREVVDSGRRRVRRQAAAHRDRQVEQAAAAPAVRRLQIARPDV